jgi:hypothetical protein
MPGSEGDHAVAGSSFGSGSGAPPLRTSRSQQARAPGNPPRQAWLDAWSDPVAGLAAFSSCIHTCNLMGNGDWRLVVADGDRKLKVSRLPRNRCMHGVRARSRSPCSTHCCACRC